jgi:hypothetical protein
MGLVYVRVRAGLTADVLNLGILDELEQSLPLEL